MTMGGEGRGEGDRWAGNVFIERSVGIVELPLRETVLMYPELTNRIVVEYVVQEIYS